MDNIFAFLAGIIVGAAFFDSWIDVVATKWKAHRMTSKIKARETRVREWVSARFVPIALSLICVSVGLSAYGGYENQRQNSKLEAQTLCSQRFANRLYDSLTPRQEVTEELQNANRNLRLKDSALTDATAALLKPGNDEEDLMAFGKHLATKQAALAEVRDKERDLEAERDAHPYPDPPKVACPE